MGDYNPDYWKCCTGITIEQFCHYLKTNVPPNAVFHVCGCDMFYMHLSNDGTVFSVDDCALSDLEEYEGYEPSNLNPPPKGET